MIRFSLIMPTSGRPSLYAAIHSAMTSGLQHDDEIIVVGDGPQLEARIIVDHFTERLAQRGIAIQYAETPPTRMVGHAQKNHGMTLAKGTHLLFMDDDDWYAKDAIRMIREAVVCAPDRIHIFRIKAVGRKRDWDYVWKDPVVRITNVGTPTIVPPNVKEKLGTWGNRYEGDFDFVDETVKKFGTDPVWHKEIIAEIL